MENHDAHLLPEDEHFEELEFDPTKPDRGFNSRLVALSMLTLSSLGGALGYMGYKENERVDAQKEALRDRFADAIAVVDTNSRFDRLSGLDRDLQKDGSPEMPDLQDRVDSQLALIREWTDLRSSVAAMESASTAATSSLSKARADLSRTKTELERRSAALQAQEREAIHARRLVRLTDQAESDALVVLDTLPEDQLAGLAKPEDVLELDDYKALAASELVARLPEDERMNEDHRKDASLHYASCLNDEVVRMLREKSTREALQTAQTEKEALQNQLRRWRSVHGQDLSRLPDTEKRRLLTEYFAQRQYFRVALSPETAEEVETHMAGRCGVQEGPWGEGCSNYRAIASDYRISRQSDDPDVRARTQFFISVSTTDRNGERISLRVPFVNRDVLEAMEQGISVFYPNDASKIRGVARYELLLATALRDNPNRFLDIRRRWKEAVQQAREANVDEDK